MGVSGFRDFEFHSGFARGEVHCEKQSLVLMISQECEMSVYVESVGIRIAVAQVVCHPFAYGLVAGSEPDHSRKFSEKAFISGQIFRPFSGTVRP